MEVCVCIDNLVSGWTRVVYVLACFTSLAIYQFIVRGIAQIEYCLSFLGSEQGSGEKRTIQLRIVYEPAVLKVD